MAPWVSYVKQRARSGSAGEESAGGPWRREVVEGKGLWSWLKRDVGKRAAGKRARGRGTAGNARGGEGRDEEEYGGV